MTLFFIIINHDEYDITFVFFCLKWLKNNIKITLFVILDLVLNKCIKIIFLFTNLTFLNKY